MGCLERIAASQDPKIALISHSETISRVDGKNIAYGNIGIKLTSLIVKIQNGERVRKSSSQVFDSGSTSFDGSKVAVRMPTKLSQAGA